MKKFCTTCGNQLELSQRFCAQCGVTNPFFVPAFTLLADQSSELDKLREEKERIEKELREKEEAQQEFLRQEILRKEKEEAERQRLLLEQRLKTEAETAEKERLLREQAEREKIETDRLLNEKLQQEQEQHEKLSAQLQQEIQRVKEETEQQKKQTADLMNEVREGLLHIDEQNRKLKDKLESIQQNFPEQVAKVEVTQIDEQEPVVKIVEAIPQPVIALEAKTEAKGNKRRVGVVILLLLFTVLAFASIYILSSHPKKQTPQAVNALDSQPQETEYTAISELDSTTSIEPETTVVENIVTESGTEVIEPKPEVKAANVVMAENTSSKLYAITEQKVKNDLVGKKISGCDITVGPNELESLSDLSFIERLPSGLLKYKCVAVIKHRDNSYYSMPYVYYDASGKFVKVDGSNCQ